MATHNLGRARHTDHTQTTHTQRPLPITSPTNSQVRLLRSLVGHRGRVAQGLFLAEGIRLAEEAVAAGIRPALVLYAPEQIEANARARRVIAPLTERAERVSTATAAIVARAADTQHSQGVVFAVPFAALPPAHGPSQAQHLTPMLVFDGIADPGNLGSLLRTARAAGCRVLLTVGCADPYAPKVVRAGAGAHFWLDRLERLEEAVITTQIRHFPQRLLATAGGARRHTDVDWSIHTALMIGGEAQGVSEAIRGLATDTVRITMPGGGESLNVGAATAVLCFAAIARGSGPEVMKRDEEDQRA